MKCGRAVVALGVLVATMAGVAATFTVVASFKFSCSAGAIGDGVSFRSADMALLIAWLVIGVAGVIASIRSRGFGAGLARQSTASTAVAITRGVALSLIL